MPYKIRADTPLLDGTGTEAIPEKEVAANTLVDRGEIRLVGTKRKIAHITTLTKPVVVGWVEEKIIYPTYGQTDKADGMVLEGNQETKDLCQRFAKELDALNLPTDQPDALQCFMIGALQCEDLDGKKVFYVSLSGNRNLPDGWEEAVKRIGAVPAPVLPNGHDHLRNLSGKTFKPIQAGSRKQKAVTATYSGPGRADQSWDDPYDPATGEGLNKIPRLGNKPGSCAAQKMLQLAIKKTDTVRYLWEQWYDANHGVDHNVAMESCATCKITVTRMLKRF
jgi:hypothetical protein